MACKRWHVCVDNDTKRYDEISLGKRNSTIEAMKKDEDNYKKLQDERTEKFKNRVTRKDGVVEEGLTSAQTFNEEKLLSDKILTLPKYELVVIDQPSAGNNVIKQSAANTDDVNTNANGEESSKNLKGQQEARRSQRKSSTSHSKT